MLNNLKYILDTLKEIFYNINIKIDKEVSKNEQKRNQNKRIRNKKL